MAKTILIIISFFLAQGMNPSVKAQYYPGCDCTSLCACAYAACVDEVLFGCAFPKGQWLAFCQCKDGGMKHCTNWDALSHCNCNNMEIKLSFCNSNNLQ